MTRINSMAVGLGLWAVCLGTAQAQSFNTELLSNWNPVGGRSGYMDIWGYNAPNGTELAIIGRLGGISFVDITDPTNPLEVGFLSAEPTSHRDMRTHGTYVYAVNESAGGLFVYDLSIPTMPLEIHRLDSDFITAHNIGVYDGYAYVVGAQNENGASGTHIFDLSDPANPVEVGRYTDRYLHDIYVRDDIAYGSAIQDRGLVIFDVTDKANPFEISFTSYPGAATHAAWLNDDGQYLLTADETPGGHIHVWDVSNLGRPFEVAQWSAHPQAIVHNVFVKGDSAYISYYTEGLQVLNIEDPTQPYLVAAYDTWPGATGGFNGNWGVYPYLESGNVILSDRATGLYVVRLVEGGGDANFGVNPPEQTLVANPGQTSLWYFFEIQNPSSTSQGFELSATAEPQWSLNHSPTISLPPNSSDVVAIEVMVPPTLGEPTMVHVELCARSTTSGQTVCATTDETTPVLLQAFDLQHRPGEGIAVHWEIETEPGDTGELSLQRSTGADFDEWRELGRFALTSSSHVDTNVFPGQTYAYRLVWQHPGGEQILGQRQVKLAAPGLSRLLGNWPNPFNPQTRIRFELGRAGSVQIGIYNGRGRSIRRLVSTDLGPGSHQIVWDGRDASGNLQPSGVYFYEVRSRSWSARGQMTMVR